MSAFVLKIIAMITMLCDHTSYLLFGHFSELNYIGRIAFPIFAFQISEGYIHTKNLKRYFIRLFLFAIISQIPFMLFRSIFTSGFALNIFFTLFLGLVTIFVYDKFNKIDCKNIVIHYSCKVFSIFVVVIAAILAQVLKFDYGAFGIAIIFIFYLFKNKPLLMNIGIILSVIIYYWNGLQNSSLFLTYLVIVIFTCIPLAFINLYNHKKGKDMKYFLYLFYPIHLLIIYFLSLLPVFPIN